MKSVHFEKVHSFIFYARGRRPVTGGAKLPTGATCRHHSATARCWRRPTYVVDAMSGGGARSPPDFKIRGFPLKKILRGSHFLSEDKSSAAHFCFSCLYRDFSREFLQVAKISQHSSNFQDSPCSWFEHVVTVGKPVTTLTHFTPLRG